MWRVESQIMIFRYGFIGGQNLIELGKSNFKVKIKPRFPNTCLALIAFKLKQFSVIQFSIFQIPIQLVEESGSENRGSENLMMRNK